MTAQRRNGPEAGIRIRSAAEYRRALDRVAALRADGATAETDSELAALEGAIAQYVGVPGQPDLRKGRPKDQQNGT